MVLDLLVVRIRAAYQRVSGSEVLMMEPAILTTLHLLLVLIAGAYVTELRHAIERASAQITLEEQLLRFGLLVFVSLSMLIFFFAAGVPAFWIFWMWLALSTPSAIEINSSVAHCVWGHALKPLGYAAALSLVGT